MAASFCGAFSGMLVSSHNDQTKALKFQNLGVVVGNVLKYSIWAKFGVKENWYTDKFVRIYRSSKHIHLHPRSSFRGCMITCHYVSVVCRKVVFEGKKYWNIFILECTMGNSQKWISPFVNNNFLGVIDFILFPTSGLLN